MNTLVKRFGRYSVVAFVVMAIGLVLLLLTPLFSWLFEVDTDFVGILIFLIGLVVWLAGFFGKAIGHGEAK